MPRRTVNVGMKNAAILSGEADLTEWDDEELLRGRRKDKHGGWRGKDPKIVPKAIHDEWVRRKFAKAYDRLADSLVDGAEVLHEIFMDPATSPADRIKAIEVVFDRVLGKPKERVALDVGQPAPAWATLLQGSIVEIVAVDTDANVLDVPSEEVGDGG